MGGDFCREQVELHMLLYMVAKASLSVSILQHHFKENEPVHRQAFHQ